MFEQLENAIRRSLRGKYIHIDPLKALEGLNTKNANVVPENGIHSCWQLLSHIVYWQDLMLSALREENVQWPKTNEESWPDNELLKDQATWDELVTKFENGIQEAEALSKKVESLDDLPAWPKVTPFAALMVFAQHNAFHLGEIIATRQALGFWPPPEYKQTF